MNLELELYPKIKPIQLIKEVIKSEYISFITSYCVLTIKTADFERKDFMQKEYATDRLLLKVLDKSQADQVLDYYIRNRDFLEEWEAEKGEEFYSVACQEQLLEKDFTDIGNRSSLRLWIYKKDDSKRIIGTLAFTNIVRGVFLSCFLGYKLDQGEINQGFMTEAVRKGIQIMFEEYGLHRIEANIMPKNARSLKVAEKLGFYNEGFARNYLKINGQWEDHIHMVLLNERMHT